MTPVIGSLKTPTPGQAPLPTLMSSPTTDTTSPAVLPSTLPNTQTSEQILLTLRDVLERIKVSQLYADDLKDQLAELHQAGIIPDSIEHHGIKATWTERKGNWSYTSAVANLKTLEEAEGIATRKPSSFFWTIKSAPNA